MDTAFLDGLSSDAAAEIATLPQAWRSCPPPPRPESADPWYRFNLSRYRARSIERGESEGDRMEFDGSGLIRLAGAVSGPDVAAMRDRIWEFLASRGIDRGDPETWPSGKPPKLQSLHRSGGFAPMASGPVRAALDALLGTWQEPEVWGLPLVTFPEPGEWAVPRTGWHVDAWGARPGVTVFVFLGPVAPNGGGTLVLAGSHPVVARELAAGAKPADIKASLAARDPWLRAVWSGGYRSAEGETELDGHRVRLVELTGAAGDVVLMHPATLHAAALNVGSVPRLMAVEIVAGGGDHPEGQ